MENSIDTHLRVKMSLYYVIGIFTELYVKSGESIIQQCLSRKYTHEANGVFL